MKCSYFLINYTELINKIVYESKQFVVNIITKISITRQKLQNDIFVKHKEYSLGICTINT